MDADDITLQSTLDSPYCYDIPAYQRYYTWEQENWLRLWIDICELIQDEGKHSHFMGALVFVPVSYRPGSNPILQVVDGQQRLVTLCILLCAVRNLARSHSLGRLADEIDETYLTNPYQEGRDHFKIYLRQRDRKEYRAAVEGSRAPQGKIGGALRFFTRRIREDILAHPEDAGRGPFAFENMPWEASESTKEVGGASGGDASDEHVEERLRFLLNTTKSALEFVSITLDGEGGAYQTFQSLNSTGVDLSQADLIRCQVMMHVDAGRQDDFDDSEWCPMERRFRDGEGKLDGKGFSRFFRHILLMKGSYVYKADTQEVFRERFIGDGRDFDPERLAARLRRLARLYDYLRGGVVHPSEEVAEAIDMLVRLDTTTAFPVALKLLAMLDEGRVRDQTVAEAIRRISGFVLRRKVCGQASTGYVRWFTFACRHLTEHEDGPLEGLTAFLEKKGFPGDEQFAEAFARYELFSSDYARVALEALERSYQHRERADLSQAEVEHIMPQSVTDEWRAMLGPDAERLHERLLHTAGNLTLSAYNGELSNKSFPEKRPEYARSNISITRHLADLKTWDADAIEARSRMLAEKAAQVWAGPPFGQES